MEFSDQTLSSVPDPTVLNRLKKKSTANTLKCSIQGTGQIEDLVASSAQAHARYLPTSGGDPKEISELLIHIVILFSYIVIKVTLTRMVV